MKTIYALFIGLLLGSPIFAAEKSSKDFAKLAPLAFAAFECHHFALMANDKPLADKLFNLAYKSGLEFLKAAQSGKIKEEDIRSQVPLGFGWIAQGPSSDFILGRLYEATSKDCNEVRKQQIGADEEAIIIRARNELKARNAEQLVRDEPDD